MADKQLEPGFGRDGLSGLVSAERAMRAREVSRPAGAAPGASGTLADDQVIRELRARAAGSSLPVAPA